MFHSFSSLQRASLPLSPSLSVSASLLLSASICLRSDISWRVHRFADPGPLSLEEVQRYVINVQTAI